MTDVWQTPMPTVKHGCPVCKVTQEDIDVGYVIVSPTGVAHHARDEWDGDTLCGHDATRDGWWWPL